jgi:hypothetical protein
LIYVSDDQGSVQGANPQIREWTFTDLDPGECVTINLDAQLADPCVAPQLVDSVYVAATHSSSCHPDVAVEDSDSAVVFCLDKPCVKLECDAEPDSACAGDEVTITATATNCSAAAEDINVIIKRPDGSVLKDTTVADVPKDGVVEVLALDTMPVCDPPELVSWNVEAVAKNECDPDGVKETCVAQIKCIPCGENCPRTPGFWTQQCAQKGNGSTKFTESEVTKIAECVDEVSVFFNWADGTDFSRFCAMIDPERPMNPEKQLKRHFAALLANYCTGELGLIANNGDKINLVLSTVMNPECPGVDAKTIAELIKEIDDALINGKTDKYGALLYCADAINNGDNIPLDPECSEKADDPDREAQLDADSFRLGKAVPNPFRRQVTVPYALSSEKAGQKVTINVYNVAGRLVRNLVSEVHAAGQFEISWDGRNNAGAGVHRGVYFVRAQIPGEGAQVTRVLYLR